MKKILRVVLVLVILLLLTFFFVLPQLVQRLANRVADHPLPEPSPQALELHDKLWIADLHADPLLWKRNLLQRHTYGHVDIPRLIEGNVALQVFSVVSKVPFGLNFEQNPADSDMITWLAVAQRWPMPAWYSLKSRALHQARKLERFAAAADDRFVIIKSQADLVAYSQRREREPGITAGLLALEGAQVIEGELSSVYELFNAGYRMMAPSHFFDTEVGGSAHGMEKGGLSELGRQTIRLMEQLGMVVDLAHASPQTIEDVLAIVRKPVVVSHTGVRGTCESTRNLSDRQLHGIAATGGVIGITFFPEAVCGDGVGAIVAAIMHAVDVAGIEHVGLGSDFDGAVQTPFDAANMNVLTGALLQAGFSGSEVALLMGGNVRRVLMQALPR